MNRPFNETGTFKVTYRYTDGTVEVHTVEAHCIDCAIDTAQPDAIASKDLESVVTVEVK